ncbi:MAG TPA: HD domain-containing phosphohydrolase [Solirubrobacteraceae bacterium]|nr:HD domain-containing phosphohydrolase [Solirubrobacteraceae bacterium]
MLSAPGDVALSEVLGALSHALDLTEGEPPGHAVRTTAIGMRLAEEIGLPDEQRSGLFYALLLKDAGCSSNAARLSSLFAADDHQAKRAMKAVDWSKPGALAAYTWRSVEPGRGPVAKARRMKAVAGEAEVTREMIATRCERGAEIARMLELPEASAGAIAALDEHWDGSGHPQGLRGEEIPLLGRILCLAQTVEIFSRTTGPRGAYAMAIKRAGRWFDPALVGALLAFRDEAAFWGPLEDPRMVPPAAAWEPADRVVLADQARLDRVADAFARVIDAKSPYTARHSTEVARWAVALGAQLEMSRDQLRDLRRAGLLHDIGKLAVSNRILDKPGRLDRDELAVVREHPRHTQRILERVACFAGIVETAASHHERLDGSGYHRGLAAFDLSRPTRVLAVADVWEALTAERPYRAAMDAGTAMEIVAADRGVGLCPAAVDALERAVAADGEPAALRLAG